MDNPSKSKQVPVSVANQMILFSKKTSLKLHIFISDTLVTLSWYGYFILRSNFAGKFFWDSVINFPIHIYGELGISIYECPPNEHFSMD
jgi:hypothetical protein